MTTQRQALPNPLRLHLNEHVAGCSPAVLAAIRALDRESFGRYPDVATLTNKCARWLGVPEDCVQLTNGLDEGLHVVAQWAQRTHERSSIRSRPAKAIVVEPAFEMYAACAEAAGLEIARVVPEPDLAFPAARVVASITDRTRLIYLNDPNNPSGLGIPAGAIEEIAELAPHALVLVDEAYAEFSGRSVAADLPQRSPNVVVGRTFAKAQGLAGLRIGALVAAPEMIASLRRLLPPFSINICAATALDAALDDNGYVDAYLAEVTQSKQLIYSFARRLGIPSWPSEGNYVLLRISGDVPGVVNRMADRGVLIRDRSQLPQCAGCIRITAGLVSATEHCLEVLEDVLASRPN